MEDYYSIGRELIKEYEDISLIDRFLESLEDLNMLNENGKSLKKDFWEEWIRE